MSALNEREKEALAATGEVMRIMADLAMDNIDAYPDRVQISEDYTEVSMAMHVIQHNIMRSAVAREHPDLVRPYGISLL